MSQDHIGKVKVMLEGVSQYLCIQVVNDKAYSRDKNGQ